MVVVACCNAGFVVVISWVLNQAVVYKAQLDSSAGGAQAAGYMFSPRVLLALLSTLVCCCQAHERWSCPDPKGCTGLSQSELHASPSMLMLLPPLTSLPAP